MSYIEFSNLEIISTSKLSLYIYNNNSIEKFNETRKNIIAERLKKYSLIFSRDVSFPKNVLLIIIIQGNLATKKQRETNTSWRNTRIIKGRGGKNKAESMSERRVVQQNRYGQLMCASCKGVKLILAGTSPVLDDIP